MLTIEQITKKILLLSRQNSYSEPIVAEFVQTAIDELLSAGITEEIAYSSKSISFILAYITDIDNPVPGAVKMSDFTKRKLIQLATISAKGDNSNAKN